MPQNQPNGQSEDKSQEFERLLLEQKDSHFELRLFVTGLTVRSLRAIDNLKAICEKELKGQYRLQVIDIQQHPDLARQEDVFAAPTLVRALPLPLRKLIGDLSDRERVLVGLGLNVKRPEE
jgi:circadian clock protein KaiB